MNHSHAAAKTSARWSHQRRYVENRVSESAINLALIHPGLNVPPLGAATLFLDQALTTFIFVCSPARSSL